jgi:hypothetical protein
MSDLALIGIKFENNGYDAAARQADSFTDKTDRTERATDRLASSNKRLSASQVGLVSTTGRASTATEQMAQDAMKAARILKEQADATRDASVAAEAAAAAQSRLHAAQMGAAGSAKIASRAGLDLGRQLSDVGVQASMGTSALMILIMQGPQIADSLGQAAKAGVGLSGVFSGMVAGLVPLAATLAPVIAVVGGATAGFALFHRELAKDYPKDLTAGLGLTAEQLKEVKNRTVTLGDTFAATFTVMGRHLMSGPLGDAVNGFKTFMSDAFDRIARGAINVSANIAGVIAVATRLGGIAVNAFKGDWDKIAAGASTSLTQTFNTAASNLRTGTAGFGAEVGREARNRAQARIIKEAGDAGKAAAPEVDKAAAALKRLREEFEALQASYMSPEEQAIKRYTDDLKALDEQLKGRAITKPEAWEAAQQALAALQKALATPIKAAEGFDLKGVTNDAAAASKALTDGFEQAERDSRSALRGISGAVDDMFGSIRDHDWAGAFGGLLSALGEVKKGWGAMSGTDRIGAISNIAGAAGAAVGGAAGAGLMGAAGGAAGGASLALALGLASNPAGWVIAGTAAIGGLLGLFGDSKAKKRQRAEEEAKRAADAAALALEKANQFRDIEIQRLQMLGKAGEARALALEAERAGIAAENLAAFDELQGLKEAAGLRALNIQLMEADGRAGEALAMRQHDALSALTPAEAELTKQIWAAQKAAVAAADAQAIYNQQLADADAAIAKAQQDLTAARNAETAQMREQAQQAAQTAQATRDTWQRFYDGLSEFQQSIGAEMGGSSLGSVSSRFFSNAARAQLGDQDAQSRFVALGQEFARSSAENAVSQVAHLRNLASIKAATEAAKLTAGRHVDIAQAQLDAANAQLAALETVNDSVLTVAEATANLANALAARAALTGASSAGGGGPPMGSVYDSASDSWVGGGTSKADIDRAHAAGIGVSGPAGDSAALLIEMYRAGQFDHLRDADGNPTGVAAQLKAAGFARGGFHSGGLRIVGENGPELESTGPSRIWNADQTSAMLGGNSSDVVDAIDALRAELSAVRSELAEVKNNTKDTAKNTRDTRFVLERVSDGGEAVRTVAA